MQRNRLSRDVMFSAAASVGLLTVVIWTGISPSIALAFVCGFAAGIGLLVAASFSARRGGQ